MCVFSTTTAISIGFQLPSYTYNEPVFDDVYSIKLIKENNVTSEQFFSIYIQASDAVPEGTNPATFIEDYQTGGVIPFFSYQQYLYIDVYIFRDRIIEGTEVFLLSSSVDRGFALEFPDYLPPMFPSTFINILDDDRELIQVHVHHLFTEVSYSYNDWI